MGGTHKFSSTTFIQSGSVAQFLNGIEVTGDVNVDGIVSATSFVDANGNSVGTGGGTVQEFFAGTAAGVNLDTPQSLDHFITLTPTNYESEESNTILSQTAADTNLVITTIGSATFTPNYYNFIKIGDLNNPAVTVQQGDSSTYTPTSVAERTAGTHRYIIYAANTSSPELVETHRVFHTVTIDAFSNNNPVIKPDDGTLLSIKPNHDKITATLTIDSSNSSDPDNVLELGEDFITKYTAKRINSAGGTLDSTLDSYDITLTHPTETETTIDNVPGIEVTNDTFPGLSGNTEGMQFTVGLSDYATVDGVDNTIKDSTPQTETYTAKVQDAYNATDTGTYTLTVSPPDIAIISAIKVKFEGGDNDGGFTNSPSDAHTHTLLYNDGSDPSTLLNTTDFAIRYQSSCVRVKVEANVAEPVGFTEVNASHTTAVKIMSSSTGLEVILNGGNTLGYFEMSNFVNNGYANKFNNTAIDSEYSILDEQDGFKTLVGNGIPSGDDSIIYYFGASTNNGNLNTIDHTRHGNHHHHKANITTPNSLTINKCPDVLIKDIDLEVETEYGTDTVITGTHTRDLLYGLDSTILSSDLGTFFPDSTIASYSSYIDQARVRVRLKCQIIEPFGPAHNQINAVITAKSGGSITGTVSTTINLTDANNDTLDTFSSIYTTDHNHTDSSQNSKELKVSTYISEFFEIELPAGTHTLNVTFADLDGVLTSKGIGITESAPTAATIVINPVADTTLSDITTEVETFGYSNIGTTTSLRTVLYGDDRQTNANSSSFVDHPLLIQYNSHSVSRFRVKGTMTEPPGPAVSTFTAQMQTATGTVIGSPITITSANNIPNIALSTDVFSQSISSAATGDRVTTFVTSWVAGEASLIAAADSSTPYTIESDFTYIFDSYSDYTTNTPSTISPTTTTLQVFDTPKTKISITNIEIETEGDSGIAAGPNNSTSTFSSAHQRTILFAESLTRPNSTGLSTEVAKTAVLKTRVQAVIIEPVGPLHFPTSMSVMYDRDPNNNFGGPKMLFGTSSDDMAVKTHIYINGGEDDGKLQTTYTSIFTGSEIGPSPVPLDNDPYELHLFDSSIIHNPTNENSFTKGTEGNLFLTNGNQTFIKINEPTSLSLTNLDVILNKTDAQILHGKFTTETNTTTNSTYNSDSQAELVTVKITATLEEPLVGNSTALITITGQDSTAPITFTLTPGGAEVESESTSGGSTNYTSIEKPIQFAAADGPSPSSTSNSDLNNDGTLDVTPPVNHPFTVTATLTNILGITEGLTPESDTATINITGAPNSTVLTTLLADGTNGSDSFSSSVFETSETASLYYVYPPGTSTGYKNNTRTLDVSQDTSVTAPTLTSVDSITYADGNVTIGYNDAGTDGSYFSISPTTITSPTLKSTLTISRPNRFNPNTNEIKQGTVTVTATDVLQGNGKDKSTREIFIIPATADSMSRSDLSGKKDYGNKSFPHQTNNSLYTGLLSLVNSSNYENDPVQGNSSTATTQQVNYIINTHDGTANDYTIQLNTHNSPVYTGHYQTSERAFNHGHKGTLSSTINGSNNGVIDLGTFNSGQKTVDQSSYPSTNNGLTINKVSPFNSIYQNLSAYGEDFPYGFQAWDATVDVNSKPRDGYNYSDLSHTFTDGTTNQQMGTFKWYYDDTPSGSIASLIASTEISYSFNPAVATTEPTFSLSGVSYFKTNSLFTASIVGITDLVGKVYPHNAAIMFTKKIESASGGTITITGDGQNSNGSGQLLHDVHNIASDTNRRGLRFATGDSDLIPTEGTTTNIHTVVGSTTLLANNVIDPSQGQNFTLKYVQNKRAENGTTHGNPTNWTETVTIAERSIGRFMYEPANVSGYQPSTNHIRQFYDEFYRWDKDDFLTNSLVEKTTSEHETFWLDTVNASYKSPLSIDNTTDLQQTFQGRLIYPSQSYSNVNPNVVDYSSLSETGDRVYYTALQIPNVGEGTDKFILRFEGNFVDSDIFTNGQAAADQTPTQQMDSKNIRIDIKIPGADSGWSNPAENLGNSSNTTLSTLNTSTGLPINGDFGWKSFQGGIQQNQMSDATPHIQLRINTRDLFPGTNTGGVVLLKVRYKSTYTDYLTKIQLIEDGNETSPTS